MFFFSLHSICIYSILDRQAIQNVKTQPQTRYNIISIYITFKMMIAFQLKVYLPALSMRSNERNQNQNRNPCVTRRHNHNQSAYELTRAPGQYGQQRIELHQAGAEVSSDRYYVGNCVQCEVMHRAAAAFFFVPKKEQN